MIKTELKIKIDPLETIDRKVHQSWWNDSTLWMVIGLLLVGFTYLYNSAGWIETIFMTFFITPLVTHTNWIDLWASQWKRLFSIRVSLNRSPDKD